MQQNTEWYTDERFWSVLYPYMFTEERFAMAEEEIDRVLALAQPSGQRALDLCCGPGRHALELARRGFAVTGVDASGFLLDRAMERAHAQQDALQGSLRWAPGDMREFNPRGEEQFDLAINLFSSFGYFANDAENNRALGTLWRSLAPGGVAVLEMISKEYLARALQPTLTTEFKDGTLQVARHWIEDGFSRIRNEWLLIRGSMVERFHFSTQLYTGVELRDRLLAEGFAEVRLFGNLLGEPLGTTTTRVVAVARK